MAAQISRPALIEIMASGRSESEAAALLQVTPSAISQCLEADEKLRDEIARAKDHTKARQLDNAYDDLEESLLRKLKGSIAFMTKPMEISRVLQTVNAAKRRTGIMAQQSTPSQVVNLVMPVAIHNKIEMNSSGQVLSVEGRPLVTMQAGQVLEMLKEKQAKDKLPLVELI